MFLKQLKYGSKKWLVILTLALFLTHAIAGYATYLLRYITDYALSQEIDLLVDTAFLIVYVFAGRFLSDLVTTWAKKRYMGESLRLMKETYVRKLLEQDVTQLQKEYVTRYHSNLTNDFDRYEEKYLTNLVIVIQMAAQFIVALFLIANINPYLILAAFVMLILFVGLTSKTSKPVKKTEHKKTESLGVYTDFVNESLSGFEIIKQHQLEQTRRQKFIERAVQVQNDNYAVDVKTTHVDALNNLIQTGILFSLIIGGVLLARETGATLGSMIVLFSAFGDVMWPLQRFSPVISQMKGISDVLEDFDQNLHRPEYDRPLSVNAFETLSFANNDLGYDEDPVLRDVNLDIQQGERILIMGPSGAGKSTILKTIRQSIEPLRGKVFLNQQNIFRIRPLDYYSLFATVDQIGFLFAGTVRDNVTLYQNIASAKVKDALQRVGLSNLDMDHELLNDGANVSGGQRARLMLARALCLDAQVIVCDEIFASLDLEIACDIEKDLLSVNKTIINVSHIMFSENLPEYDKIYIVENGTVRLAQSLQEVEMRMIAMQK